MDITDDYPTRYLHRGMAALDLANAFADELLSDGPDGEREAFVNTVLCAGQHVYELSGPGHWEAFEAVEFDRQMPCRNARERERMFFDLVGFFGWMAMNGLIADGAAIRILGDLVRHGPAGGVHVDIAETTIGILKRMAN